MSRQHPPTPASAQHPQQEFSALTEDGFDLQRELDGIERLVLQSYHIPWTNITFVNETQLLAQLDRAFESIPTTLREARDVLRDRQDILQQAQAHARKLVQEAERQAAQIRDETGIIRRAQQDARQLHEQARIECDRLRQQTLQDIKQMHQQAVAECEDMRADAEDYVTAMLAGLEHQLGGMLKTVRNGRASLSQPQPLADRQQPTTATKQPAKLPQQIAS